MQISQIRWSKNSGWESAPAFAATAELVLVFADEAHFQSTSCFTELRERFPKAHILGCSSSGTVAGAG